MFPGQRASWSSESSQVKACINKTSTEAVEACNPCWVDNHVRFLVQDEINPRVSLHALLSHLRHLILYTFLMRPKPSCLPIAPYNHMFLVSDSLNPLWREDNLRTSNVTIMTKLPINGMSCVCLHVKQGRENSSRGWRRAATVLALITMLAAQITILFSPVLKCTPRLICPIFYLPDRLHSGAAWQSCRSPLQFSHQLQIRFTDKTEEDCRPADQQTHIPAYLQTYRHIDIQTCIPADIQTYRHTDLHTCRIHTYRHTDLHTYRHIDLHTCRHTDI